MFLCCQHLKQLWNQIEWLTKYKQNYKGNKVQIMVVLWHTMVVSQEKGVLSHSSSFAFYYRSSFGVTFLWAQWPLLSPAPSHLEFFQTGNHSAFEGCWRQKPLAIVGSVHVSTRSSASRFCFSTLLHSVPMLFFLEHSWGYITARLQFKGIQLAHFQPNSVECLNWSSTESPSVMLWPVPVPCPRQDPFVFQNCGFHITDPTQHTPKDPVPWNYFSSQESPKVCVL